jgi:hypothetical protein
MRRVMYNMFQKKAEKVFCRAVKECCIEMGFSDVKIREQRIICTIEGVSIHFTITSVEQLEYDNSTRCDLSIATFDFMLNRNQGDILTSPKFNINGVINEEGLCNNSEYMKDTWITPALFTYWQTIIGFSISKKKSHTPEIKDSKWWGEFLNKCAVELEMPVTRKYSYDYEKNSFPAIEIDLLHIKINIYIATSYKQVICLKPRIFPNQEFQMLDLMDHFCPLGESIRVAPNERDVKKFLIKLLAYVAGHISCASLLKRIEEEHPLTK